MNALREREFRLLFAGSTISTLGDSMTAVALAFAVLAIGGSASSLGLVMAAGAVPFLLFLLVGGVVADRLPRRGVMLSADVVRLVAKAVMAALLIGGSAEVWQLIVLQAVHGVASAFFGPASTGLMPHVVSPEHLKDANALRGISGALAWIAGPALAGVLVAATSPGWALAVDAATFGVSALFLAALHLPPHERLPGSDFFGDLRVGWTEFTARRWVWVTVLNLCFVNVLGSGLYVLGPVMAEQELGGVGAWAAITAAGSVGALIGSTVVMRTRPRRPIFTGLLTCSLGASPAALLAIPAPVPLIALAMLIAGAGLLIFNTLWETTLQQYVAPEALSRVSAYDWLGSFIANPIGLAVAGPIAAVIGLNEALALTALGEFSAIMVLLAMPSVRAVTARA